MTRCAYKKKKTMTRCGEAALTLSTESIEEAPIPNCGEAAAWSRP